MVFSGRVECVVSESGVMGSARFVFGVRFAENMILAYRTLSGQRPYIYIGLKKAFCWSILEVWMLDLGLFLGGCAK